LAELEACVEIASSKSEAQQKGPGFAVFELEEGEVRSTIERLALTHRAGTYLGSCPLDDLRSFCSKLELPDGTVAVRVKRFEGRGTPDQANSIMRITGEAVSRSRKIDLTHPDIRLRVLLSEDLHFYLDENMVDRDQYERRHVRSRPFFSPISLHPRYARALVNLTGVRRGQTLLDPFCGTGGILMEAALVGAKAIGSDISGVMIEGCKENMSHFGAEWDRLEAIDIGEVPGHIGEVDAVATDPPYGRSASTMREPVRELHQRGLAAISQCLKPWGLAGVVLPYPCSSKGPLNMLQSHMQRVHRSLDRHYCILKRC
jgi:tRNA (guanine10-N2)-dimethyltransferase